MRHVASFYGLGFKHLRFLPLSPSPPRTFYRGGAQTCGRVRCSRPSSVVISCGSRLFARPEGMVSLPYTSGTTCDEHVLAARIVEGFPVEPAVERLQVQLGDVQQAEPLVFGCPPQGTH